MVYNIDVQNPLGFVRVLQPTSGFHQYCLETTRVCQGTVAHPRVHLGVYNSVVQKLLGFVRVLQPTLLQESVMMPTSRLRKMTATTNM